MVFENKLPLVENFETQINLPHFATQLYKRFATQLHKLWSDGKICTNIHIMMLLRNIIGTFYFLSNLKKKKFKFCNCVLNAVHARS